MVAAWSQDQALDVSAPYVTAVVERGDITTTLTATGRLTALVTVSVGSQLSGQVAALHADFNDTVRRGQVLAELDPRSFEARAREAEAALEVARVRVELARSANQRAELDVGGARGHLAEAEAAVERARVVADEAERGFQRAQSLQSTLSQSSIDASKTAALSSQAELRMALARRDVAEQQVLAAEAEAQAATVEIRHAKAAVEQQVAALDQARLDLERTVIVSPIDGMVISRDVNLGQTVAASLEAPTLFTIAQDLREMQVLASVDEADISRVRIGQRARFSVDAHPDLTFAAIVSDIHKAPRIEQNVVAYTVVLTAENSDMMLLPGMTASAAIITDSAEKVVKIPNAALYFQPDAALLAGAGSSDHQSPTVWLPGEGGSLVASPVRIGRSDGSFAEVLDSRLEVGQEIVVGTASPPERPSLLARLLGA